jgi:hypothetical protein
MMNMMMMDQQGRPAIRAVLCGPAAIREQILKFKGFYFWTFAQTDDKRPVQQTAWQRGGRGGQGQQAERPKLGPGHWADILAENLRNATIAVETPEPHELEWEPGFYGLDQLIVMRPTRSPAPEPERRRFDVLVSCFFSGYGPVTQVRGRNPGDAFEVGDGVQVRSGPPDRKDLDGHFWGAAQPTFMAQQGLGDGWQTTAPTLELPSDFWDQVDLGFELCAGQINEWTIPLPDQLIKAVREALKMVVSSTPKPAASAPPGVPN